MLRTHLRPLTRTFTSLALLAAAAACGGPETSSFAENWTYRAGGEAVTAERGMVVTTDEIASKIGVDVLSAGGNAVDAAIAVQFALAVVNPEAGNIGGGGFMVLRTADGSTAALDFREKAPLAATRDMYLDEQGNVTDRSVVGHLAAGVPGSVAGMWAAHERYGSLPWADLVAPSVRLAEGFEVQQRFLGSLSSSMVESLSRFEASAAQFLPRDGQPPLVGDTLRQPDLARTLARDMEQGPDGFYRGETADLIVAEMERGGGIISNVVDFGMNVVDAVHAPRVHHQHLPDQIQYERGGLRPSVVARLEALGHTVTERSGISGDVQMIVIDNGRITAWSDPRRGGKAIGY